MIVSGICDLRVQVQMLDLSVDLVHGRLLSLLGVYSLYCFGPCLYASEVGGLNC